MMAAPAAQSVQVTVSAPLETSATTTSAGAGQPERPGDPAPNARVVLQTEVPRAPQCRFLPGKAKEMIGAILREKLTGAKYDAETAPTWVREITASIKAQLKDMDMDRYKLVVQAVLGEQRGQGFQMSCRCFWDPNTDNYAHESFTNDSIFCVAGAFALYMY